MISIFGKDPYTKIDDFELASTACTKLLATSSRNLAWVIDFNKSVTDCLNEDYTVNDLLVDGYTVPVDCIMHLMHDHNISVQPLGNNKWKAANATTHMEYRHRDPDRAVLVVFAELTGGI